MTETSIAASAAETTTPVNPVPRPPAGEEEPEFRIRHRSVTLDGTCALLGSLAGSLGLTWLVYERILPTSGALGFWLVALVLFLAFYAAVAALVWGPRAVADRLAGAVMAFVGLFIVFVVVDQVAYTVYKGRSSLDHLNFYTQDARNATPNAPLDTGGVFHALIGSLEQMGIATAIAVPLGFLAALFLVEVGGRMARPVRSLIEAMTSLPEIIAALFIYAVILLNVGLRQTGLAAGLALTIMMIPFVARSSEVMLRLVPNNLREASYALGASQWRTVWTVVLPTARSGLTTAVVLGMARAIGETAPVLITSGYNVYLNKDPTSGWQTSLPLYIYTNVRAPTELLHERAFGAAVVLMALVLVLFVLARVLGGKAPGELTRRQRRRVIRDRLAYETTSRNPGRSATDKERTGNESA
jgi:phosphate transport system permease protein